MPVKVREQVIIIYYFKGFGKVCNALGLWIV